MQQEIRTYSFGAGGSITSDQPHSFTGGPGFAFARDIENARLRDLQAPVPFRHIVTMHVNDAALPLPGVAQVEEILSQLLTERLE